MHKVILPIIVVAVVAILVSGCSIGNVKTTTSKLDKTTVTELIPYGSALNKVYFSLVGDPKDKNKIIMAVSVNSPHRFDDEDSLVFKVEDDTYSFRSIDKNTEFAKTTFIEKVDKGVSVVNNDVWGTKRYRIDKSFLERLASSKWTAVRVKLEKDRVIEDELILARRAFATFLAAYDGTKIRVPRYDRNYHLNKSKNGV